MTALPTVAYLRRHALPEHFLPNLAASRPHCALAFANTPPARPTLVATWHVSTQGRPVCRWSVEGVSAVPSG